MTAVGSFAGILRRELESMQRLSAVLADEFAALGRGDVDALEATLQRKSAVLEELQACAVDRVAALQTAGIAASREAIEAWLKMMQGDGLATWNDLMTRTLEVQGIHQTNQALLEGLARHNQQALELLARLANPDQTYQADGSAGGSGFGPRSRGTA